MRTIIALVAMIAALGVSPAPAEADLFKKIGKEFNRTTTRVLKEGERVDDNIEKDVQEGRQGGRSASTTTSPTSFTTAKTKSGRERKRSRA